MARQYDASAVISFFSGEDCEHIGELVCDGSDDELGMELEDDSDDDVDDNESLELSHDGKLQIIQIKYNNAS